MRGLLGLIWALVLLGVQSDSVAAARGPLPQKASTTPNAGRTAGGFESTFPAGEIKWEGVRTPGDSRKAKRSGYSQRGPVILRGPVTAAQKPPMGFNTWNAFGVRITEDLMKTTANLMQELGLVEAGYTYFNLDDGWPDWLRDKEGKLRAHSTKFPSGIPALVDYVKARGMKLGLYTDAGVFTCAGYPGSLDYELVDAATFAQWNVSYLKVDNCWADPGTVVKRYQAMGTALSASGPKGMVYSLCSWGMGAPWLGWGRDVGGHTWRTSRDIRAEWQSILYSLDSVQGLAQYAGPGGWNDPDMLEVGNGGLPLGMQRAHFALWALVKAPLLIGADLVQLSTTEAGKESLGVLKAKEVIALNQDPLGVAGDLVWTGPGGNTQIWAAPLQGGARGVVVLNREPPSRAAQPVEVSVPWTLLGFDESTEMTIRDLYAEKDVASKAMWRYTVSVPPADCVALKLTPSVSPSARSRQRSRAQALKRWEEWRPWRNEQAWREMAAQAAWEGRDGIHGQHWVDSDMLYGVDDE